MNKHSDPGLAGNLSTLLAASAPADNSAGTMHDSASQASLSEVEVLDQPENRSAADKAFVAAEGAANKAMKGARGSEAKEGTPDTPPLTAADKPEKVEERAAELYDELINNPDAWYKLNLRLKDFRAKDLLFGIEDVIKEKGHENVRELLMKHKDKLNADLIWSFHQPLLSLLYFVFKGINDIHRKLVRVPDLKTDICEVLELGEPTGKKLRVPKPEEDLVSKPKRPKRSVENLAASGSKGEQEAKESPRTIKRLIVFKPGEKKAADKRGADLSLDPEPREEAGRPKSALGKQSTQQLEALDLEEEDPPGLLSPRLASGQSEPKKSLRIKKRPLQDEERKEKASPKKARKKETPLTGHVLHFDEESELQPRQSLEERLEDAQIAGLVRALRARGARDARAQEELDLEERLDELEAQQSAIAQNLEQLKAERAALVEQRLGHAGDPGVSEPISAARHKCLQTIVDLLDVLPPTLDLNAVEVFNELEATDTFDESLGALVTKQRAYLQRDWERKNAMAAEARRAALAAIRKKDNLRQHLGILAASTKEETAEFDAVFSAFQLKLIELRREMEQQVTLLAEKGRDVQQAWLVYRAAA